MSFINTSGNDISTFCNASLGIDMASQKDGLVVTIISGPFGQRCAGSAKADGKSCLGTSHMPARREQ